MMMIHEAVRALDVDWNGKDTLFTGVSTDSRTLSQGDLFIALSGENFDGNQFVASAEEKGAVAAMIRREADHNAVLSDLPLLRVKDTRLGLGQLAAYWRARFTMPVVGVTGSNGKTTVKEMIACILRQATLSDTQNVDSELTQVLATQGNLNNDIGVPQMLLRLRKQHQYAVIEMGMNHVGEISYLTQLTKPDIAVITNAGAAHIEGLGSVETVAQAKGEIFEGLDQQGTAVINADDVYAPLWRQLAGNRRIVDFGFNSAAQIRAECDVSASVSKMNLILPKSVVQVNLHAPGVHNVRNALAAATAAVALGINISSVYRLTPPPSHRYI